MLPDAMYMQNYQGQSRIEFDQAAVWPVKTSPIINTFEREKGKIVI